MGDTNWKVGYIQGDLDGFIDCDPRESKIKKFSMGPPLPPHLALNLAISSPGAEFSSSPPAKTCSDAESSTTHSSLQTCRVASPLAARTAGSQARQTEPSWYLVIPSGHFLGNSLVRCNIYLGNLVGLIGLGCYRPVPCSLGAY